MISLTRFAIKAAATAGFRIGRMSRTLQYRRSRALRELNISVVLDVGANEGQYASEIRELGYKERIVSFEPLSIPFQRLQNKARGDTKHECLHTALGDADGTVVINVSENLVSSSLLEVDGDSVRACPASARVRIEETRLGRLDTLRSDIIHPRDRIHLKIDTQGTEKNVLLGASRVLEQVNSVELELSLVSLYKGQTLMPEMYEMMADLGFQCVWLERGFTDPASNDILQMDGLFLRSSARKSV